MAIPASSADQPRTSWRSSDVHVDREEGEGQEAAEEHGGGVAARETERPGRCEAPERQERDREPGERGRREHRRMIAQEPRRENRGTDRHDDRPAIAPPAFGPGLGDDRSASAIVAVRRRARLDRDRPQRPEGDRPGDRDERQEAQEDEPPVPDLGHEAGHDRPEDAGQDPGGGQRGEHLGSQPVGHAPADRDVGDGRHRAGAKPLDEPPHNDRLHRRREPADEEADREQDEPADERQDHPPLVDQAADDGDPDERPEEKGGEDPAVELEAAEIAGHDRHRGRHGQGLRRDEGDRQDEPEGQRSAGRRPERVRPMHWHGRCRIGEDHRRSLREAVLDRRRSRRARSTMPSWPSLERSSHGVPGCLPWLWRLSRRAAQRRRPFLWRRPRSAALTPASTRRRCSHAGRQWL